MDKPLSSYSCQGSRWNWNCVSSMILNATSEKNEEISLALDEQLKDQFLSVLRRCNMLPKTRSIPDTLYISENNSERGGESTYSSISDSAHIRGKFKRKNCQRGGKNIRDYLPSKYKAWKPKRHSKQKKSPNESKSPLLNSNAIHKRGSLNMFDVDEVWSDNCSDDEQENNSNVMNRRKKRTMPFKPYKRLDEGLVSL